jgi:hypothetical protein
MTDDVQTILDTGIRYVTHSIMRASSVSTSIVLCCAVAVSNCAGFQFCQRRKNPSLHAQSSSGVAANPCPVDDARSEDRLSRRAALAQSMGAIAASASLLAAATAGWPSMVQASVGDLPEFADTNAILQGITVKVTDPSQQKAMIQFLEDGFDCQVLRKRIVGSIEETWIGFGPEQLSIPADFTLPVSSMANYGGHAAIHLVYDAKATAPLYTMGNNDGTRSGGVGGSANDNIAYLQMGVPSYRISQMVRHGGNILDAYAFVSVISPAGLPIRGIVGIAPDPIMLVAIHCADVKQSRAFYEQLGFVEQDYPYCRPNKGMGQFEPVQPAKSVYMAPSPNCMGVLLLPSKKKISINPCIQSLNVVYSPSSAAAATDSEQGALKLVDPSGVPISFQSVAAFQQEEAITR